MQLIRNGHQSTIHEMCYNQIGYTARPQCESFGDFFMLNVFTIQVLFVFTKADYDFIGLANYDDCIDWCPL